MADKQDDRKHLMHVGLLVATVAVVLVSAAVLNVPDAGEGTFVTTAEDDPAGIGEIETIDPLAEDNDEGDYVPADADTSLVSLAERAESDLSRVSGYDDQYTLQLGNLCDRQNVEQMIRQYAGDDRLLVLPSFVNDQPCFRLCWGRYPTMDDARNAPDRPNPAENPYPRRIAEVLP